MILDDGTAAISDPTLYMVAFHGGNRNFDGDKRSRYTPPTFQSIFPSEVFSDEMRGLAMAVDVYSFAMIALEVGTHALSCSSLLIVSHF